MNIAITGASGFIGEKLSWYLQRSGSDVIALVRSKEKEKNLNKIGLRTRVCDITNVSSLKDAFQGINIVVHLAALFNNPEASWDYYHLVNVEGTRIICEECLKKSLKKFVYCSTQGIHGDIKNPPGDEDIGGSDREHRRFYCRNGRGYIPDR